MDEVPEFLLVTPEQLKQGWVEYRRDEIPNVIHHAYVVLDKTPAGNYVVCAPRLDEQPQYRQRVRSFWAGYPLTWGDEG